MHLLKYTVRLLSLCAEKENVSFIDVTSMFKLEDGSFNDGFMCEDGVHLTNRGVNKLAKLLELLVINKSVGCVTEFQQSGTQDHDGEWITKKRRVQNYRNNNNSPGVDNMHYCYKCGENHHSKKDCHFLLIATNATKQAIKLSFVTCIPNRKSAMGCQFNLIMIASGLIIILMII